MDVIVMKIDIQVFYNDRHRQIQQVWDDIEGEVVVHYPGYSVSLYQAVAIGVYGKGGNDGGSGNIKIFDYDTQKIQTGKNTDRKSSYDRSRQSFYLSQYTHTIMIDTFGNDGNVNSSKHTRVFEYDSTC